MSRAIEGVLAGGLIAGVVWYTRREQKKADAAATAAARLATLAEARAQAAAAVALGDRAVADGNAAAAASIAARRPPPEPLATPTPSASAPNPPSPAPRASSRKPSAGLTRRFDDLFALHGRGIPVAYLRALANAESGMRPHDRLGLINVVPIALADYNRRHPETPVKPEELTDPATSIRVAADILRTVIDSYRKHHSDVPNLVEDWRNPRFVELLVAGWNSGFSQAQGVGRVVNFLKKPGSIVDRSDITIDRVFDAAWTAGATRHLSNPRKLAYSKGVAAAYSRESRRDARDGIRAR